MNDFEYLMMRDDKGKFWIVRVSTDRIGPFKDEDSVEQSFQELVSAAGQPVLQ